MIETWKPVVGFESIYSVSDLGRVRREKPENNTFAGRILKPDFPVGYAQYTLYTDGVRHRFKAHQLVAAAFIGPCPDGKQINHKDGVKLHNWPDNLEYVTGLENHQHAARTGLTPSRERNGLAKLTQEAVQFIRQNCRPHHPEFGLRPLGIKFGVSRSAIASALDSKTWGKNTHLRLKGWNKLSINDVLAIKAELAKGVDMEELALRYQVTRTNIRHIRDGKTWKQVTI